MQIGNLSILKTPLHVSLCHSSLVHQKTKVVRKNNLLHQAFSSLAKMIASAISTKRFPLLIAMLRIRLYASASL